MFSAVCCGVWLELSNQNWREFRTDPRLAKFYYRLPQKHITPSKGIVVAELIVYVILALLIYGLSWIDYRFAFGIKTDFDAYMYMIGPIALMCIIFKPCRVSMALLGNIALLGLLTYRIDAGAGMGIDSNDAVASSPDVTDASSVSGDISDLSAGQNIIMGQLSRPL